MSVNNTGMFYPTTKGMLAGNPRDSAMAEQHSVQTKLTNLQKVIGGGKRKQKTHKTHKTSKGGSMIKVPQIQMSYTVQNGPGQDPNSQVIQNSQISTQGAANAVYDKYATQKGGKLVNNNMTWGCYSGGKKTKTKRNKMKKGKRKNASKHRKYKI